MVCTAHAVRPLFALTTYQLWYVRRDMSLIHYVSRVQARALGDLRAAKPGDVIILAANAPERKDWPRYADAIGSAVIRGADVRWVR